jgi:hypothetical protein
LLADSIRQGGRQSSAHVARAWSQNLFAVQVVVTQMQDHCVATCAAQLILRSGEHVILPIVPTDGQLQLTCAAHINRYLESCGQNVAVDNDVQPTLLASFDVTATMAHPSRVLAATRAALARLLPLPAGPQLASVEQQGPVHDAADDSSADAAHASRAPGEPSYGTMQQLHEAFTLATTQLAPQHPWRTLGDNGDFCSAAHTHQEHRPARRSSSHLTVRCQPPRIHAAGQPWTRAVASQTPGGRSSSAQP